MNWEDSNGITGWQKAIAYLNSVQSFADFNTVFVHEWLSTTIMPGVLHVPSFSTAGWTPPGPVDTTYDIAILRAVLIAHSYFYQRTCVVFVSDGTEEWTWPYLNFMKSYFEYRKKKTGCPYCFKCVLTHTTISDPFDQGAQGFISMCKNLGASIDIQYAQRPNQGWGQWGFKTISSTTKLRSSDINRPN